MWMGETPKNVSALFRLAREEDAVLLFDEADAIASRRSSSVEHGMQRESNTVVNVMLQELETFNGVVIFTTNLAANFDPAFERRIRTHVLFEMPGVDEREQHLEGPVPPDADAAGGRRGFPRAGGELRGERRRHPQRGAEGGARGGERTGQRRLQGDPSPSPRRRHPRRRRRQTGDASVAVQPRRRRRSGGGGGRDGRRPPILSS